MRYGQLSNRYATVTARCVKRRTGLLLEPMRLFQEVTFISRGDRPPFKHISRLHLRFVCSVPPVVLCCFGTMRRNFPTPCSSPQLHWIHPYRHLHSVTYTSRQGCRGTKLLTGGRKASSIDHLFLQDVAQLCVGAVRDGFEQARRRRGSYFRACGAPPAPRAACSTRASGHAKRSTHSRTGPTRRSPAPGTRVGHRCSKVV
jgi:hypothetical protein